MEEEGKEFSVAKNETLILWPGRRHRGAKAYGEDLSFYWIHFRIQKDYSPVTVEVPQHAVPARPERLTELFHRFLDDQESSALLPEEAGLLVSLMLLEVRRPAANVSRTVSTLTDRAERFIHENFHRGIHAGDVARALGCNPDYLGSIFRRVFNCTLSHAIHRKQIEEARVLLRESHKNMEEIALSCGFKEPRYFRKLFTEHQGIGPRAYRKLYARQQPKGN